MKPYLRIIYGCAEKNETFNIFNFIKIIPWIDGLRAKYHNLPARRSAGTLRTQLSSFGRGHGGGKLHVQVHVAAKLAGLQPPPPHLVRL